MKTIFETNTFNYEISKSKFIGIIFHTENIASFKETLLNIKNEYPKATHYCYAYSINNQKKNNDDGEPGGTAGMPMIEAIINNQLDNIGLVIIRYFGGIKLGAGGLTRTYRRVADETIKTANIKTLQITKQYKLTFDYTFNSSVEKFINKKDIKTMSKEYNEFVECVIATNEDINELINICNGKIKIEQIKETTLIINS